MGPAFGWLCLVSGIIFAASVRMAEVTWGQFRKGRRVLIARIILGVIFYSAAGLDIFYGAQIVYKDRMERFGGQSPWFLR